MKFLNDGNAFAKVQALREQIAETAAELDALRTAPLPLDDAVARVRKWIDSAQDDSGLAYHLTGWCMSPEGGDLPRGLEGWTIGGDSPPVDLLRETMRILALVAGDVIQASIKAQVARRLADREPGPPIAERPAIRKALEAKLFDLEVKEESEIEKLEAQGHMVHRRDDAKAEIILAE